MEKLKENPRIQLIDVRSASEFESAHIPGSHNIPINNLEEHGSRILETVRDPIVFVCLSGMRAAQAHKQICDDPAVGKLIKPGLTHIHFLGDGLKTWESAGGEIKRGLQIWSLERQVQLVTGSIVLVSVVFSELVPWSKWIAAFIGAGLTFAALTNFCGLAQLLARMPWNRSNQADVGAIVDKLITKARPAAD
jgi:rhodanese-related sulfurtransferase